MFGGGTRKLLELEPDLNNDPRFKLYPQWIQEQLVSRQMNAFAASVDPTAGNGKMVMDVMRAGGLIVAGTDTPNAINLHGEIAAYVAAGMTPYEALKAATVNPAQALALDAGTIEAGKLADLDHGRRRSACERRERAQGAPRDRERPCLRDGAVDQSRGGAEVADPGASLTLEGG